MASAVNEIVKATGQGFDEERKILNADDTSAFLLVRKGQTDDFSILIQLSIGWKNRFSEFREQMNLEIATLDDLVKIAIRKCSDMSIDGHVYEIDNKDKFPPDGDHPQWRLFGTKTGEMFFPDEGPIPLGRMFWEEVEW